jgi:hypothetical protein
MMLVQKALENAASAAAASNAAIAREQQTYPQHMGQSLLAATGKKYRYPHGRCGSDQLWSPGTDTSMSGRCVLQSVDTSYGTGDYTYEEGDSSYSLASYSARSFDNSVDQSYSSWSKSLDCSFATGHTFRVGADTPVSQLTNLSMMNSPVAFATTPVVSKRRNKQMKMIRRVCIVAVSTLTIVYFSDVRGYTDRLDRMQASALQPLGMAGLVKTVCMLLFFAKLQFLCRAEPLSSSTYLRSSCKCPFMRMRAHAMSSQGGTNQ